MATCADDDDLRQVHERAHERVDPHGQPTLERRLASGGVRSKRRGDVADVGPAAEVCAGTTDHHHVGGVIGREVAYHADELVEHRLSERILRSRVVENELCLPAVLLDLDSPRHRGQRSRRSNAATPSRMVGESTMESATRLLTSDTSPSVPTGRPICQGRFPRPERFGLRDTSSPGSGHRGLDPLLCGAPIS